VFKGGHYMSSSMRAWTAVEQKNTLLPFVSKFYANCCSQFISQHVGIPSLVTVILPALVHR
jgi:hypothetical protein